MALNTAYSKYKENSINSASPEELTLMLYNGLVRFIMQAQRSVEGNDPEGAHHYIIKAQDIIMEFEATLDMQYEISNSLMLLYDYMHRRLIDANLKKDNKILDEVLHMATELRDTWEQAMKIAKQNQNQPEVANK